MSSAGEAARLVLLFVGLYPVVTSALWVAGGLLFRLCDGREPGSLDREDWPGVTVLVPAFNEAQVIDECVRAFREVDYPLVEILILDDGSRDDTAAVAGVAAEGDPRVQVVRDMVNVGKADRLNLGFARARHDLVLVTDADTHLHPQALKLLVARLERSPLVGAVAGAPHVTNRKNLLCAFQIIEVASIIGLIRRTQALTGRVGVVAGVLGLFRKDAVSSVGGYRGEMATEDIDLTWRLLLAGWHTAYEPEALVGMQVPAAIRPLWAQRRRWARGQGEVLRVHLRELSRWDNRRLWFLALEGLASLAWVLLLIAVYVVLIVLAAWGGVELPSFSALALFFVWGIAVSVVATFQLTFALGIDYPYDRLATITFLLGPLYPIAYWLLTAVAAVRAEVPALLRGPTADRVVWDIQRETDA